MIGWSCCYCRLSVGLPLLLDNCGKPSCCGRMVCVTLLLLQPDDCLVLPLLQLNGCVNE